MQRLLADPSPAAQAEALVTYSLVGEGVLGDAGYHVFSTALARGDSMPGFREGLRHSQTDEGRHMAYGLFLLSRLVAEDRAVWTAVSRQMEELLPLTLGIVSEFFESYDPMPFGLSLDATVQDAIARFAARWGALEEAKLRGHALAGTPGADQVVRDILRRGGGPLEPVPIEVRRGGAGAGYTFPVGSGQAAGGGGGVVVTPGGGGHPTATHVIPGLRAHRGPPRAAGGR